MLTLRAGAEVCRQVGQLCRLVASLSDEYGVAWDTAWAAVVWHGRPLVDDPRRVRQVRALGVDEHSFLAATREHHSIFTTALVDLDRRRMIDLFEGRSAARLRNWCSRRSKRWLAGVGVVALDLTDTYRAGLSPHLSHAVHVADPFQPTRVGNRTVDLVRRRVQNEQLGIPVERARRLDQGLGRLTDLWAGEFEPRPLQRPRIPVWVAAVWPKRRPVRRTLRWDGLFPIDLARWPYSSPRYPREWSLASWSSASVLGSVSSTSPAPPPANQRLRTGGANEQPCSSQRSSQSGVLPAPWRWRCTTPPPALSASLNKRSFSRAIPGDMPPATQ